MTEGIMTEQERIEALARLIEKGTDLSYEEWKRGVKRPSAVCVAEHLVRSGIMMKSESNDPTREKVKGQ